MNFDLYKHAATIPFEVYELDEVQDAIPALADHLNEQGE